MDVPRSVPKAPVCCFIGFHVAPVARVGTCAGVKAVAWSPDGRKLATGGAGSSAEGGDTGVSCHLSGSGFLVLATSNNTVLVCSNSTHSFHRLSMRCEKVVSELLSPVVLTKADAILRASSPALSKQPVGDQS